MSDNRRERSHAASPTLKKAKNGQSISRKSPRRLLLARRPGKEVKEGKEGKEGKEKLPEIEARSKSIGRST